MPDSNTSQQIATQLLQRETPQEQTRAGLLQQLIEFVTGKTGERRSLPQPPAGSTGVRG